jgi:hypothetical protein
VSTNRADERDLRAPSLPGVVLHRLDDHAFLDVDQSATHSRSEKRRSVGLSLRQTGGLLVSLVRAEEPGAIARDRAARGAGVGGNSLVQLRARECRSRDRIRSLFCASQRSLVMMSLSDPCNSFQPLLVTTLTMSRIARRSRFGKSLRARESRNSASPRHGKPRHDSVITPRGGWGGFASFRRNRSRCSMPSPESPRAARTASRDS